MGRYADADDQYDAVRVLDWGVDVTVENNQAIALLHLGEPKEAVQLARAAVASDPLDPLFLETLSSAYAHAGDPRRAAAAARRALQSDPTLFQAWYDLGVAL